MELVVETDDTEVAAVEPVGDAPFDGRTVTVRLDEVRIIAGRCAATIRCRS
jgi:hypothetical protein